MTEEIIQRITRLENENKLQKELIKSLQTQIESCKTKIHRLAWTSGDI
jgi:chorismate mutase